MSKSLSVLTSDFSFPASKHDFREKHVIGVILNIACRICKKNNFSFFRRYVFMLLLHVDDVSRMNS